MKQLEGETLFKDGSGAFNYTLCFNCLSAGSDFNERADHETGPRNVQIKHPSKRQREPINEHL